MDKQGFKDIIPKCLKDRKMAGEKAFIIVALDREVAGIGNGAALVWQREGKPWKFCFMRGANRDALPKEMEEEIIMGEDDEGFTEEFVQGDLMPEEEESPQAADYHVGCMNFGSRVDIFFHANRTEDGITIKSDDAKMGKDDDGTEMRDIPIVYWNTGSMPVKADGCPINPGQYRIVFPDDMQRGKRRKLRAEQMKQIASGLF